MNLFQAVSNSFKKTLDIKGRTRRSEYWTFILFAAILCVLIGFLDKVIFGVSWPLKETIVIKNNEIVSRGYAITTNYGPISKWCSYLFLIPIIPATIRRLHDVKFSGLILLIPTLYVYLVGYIGYKHSATTALKLSIVFWVMLLVLMILLFKDSDYENKYGPSEKYPNKGVSNPMMD